MTADKKIVDCILINADVSSYTYARRPDKLLELQVYEDVNRPGTHPEINCSHLD
jgi:hypothetical protein